MNMTLDNTVKSYVKSCTRENLGRILLKGDGISLIEENIVDTRFEDVEEDKDNTDTTVRKRMRQEKEEKECKKVKDYE